MGFILCLFIGISCAAQSGSGAPQLTGINPAVVTSGSGGFTLLVAGGNFGGNAVVRVNGNPRPTAFASPYQLLAAIPGSDLAAVGQLNVSVQNPGVGGGESLPLSLAITSTPIPLVGSLSPARVVAGGASFALTVGGNNFSGDSVVQINGASRATSFVSPSQLTATILAGDIASSGFPNVTVVSPSTGAASNPGLLTVFRYGDLNFDNIINILDLFTLNSIIAGTSTPRDAITADLNLDGFIDVTDVFILGNYLAGNIHTLPASLPPLIDSLAPGKVVAGGPSFTLTVNGKFFPHNSVVQVNGAGRPTIFVSPVQLTASIPASDIAVSGFPNVTVLAPSSGAASDPVPLTVFRYGDLNFDNTINVPDLVTMANYLGGNLTLTDPITADLNLDGFIDFSDLDILANYLAGNIHILPASPPPSLEAIGPQKIVAGGPAFTLNLGGHYFPHDAVVQINGAGRPTSFGDPHHVTATIPSSDISTSGFLNVTVLSPSKGVTSNAIPLTVFRYCDVNFDNIINVLDLNTFANYIAGNTTLPDPAPADVNLDGRIDTLDLLICANYMAGNIHTLPVPTADFSISASPAVLTVTAGDTASYAISVAGLNGATTEIGLSVSGLPADTAGFSDTSILGAGTSYLTVPTSSSTPAGYYSVTITGTSGGFTHSATVTLSVVPPLPPDNPTDPCGGGGGVSRDILQPCLSN